MFITQLLQLIVKATSKPGSKTVNAPSEPSNKPAAVEKAMKPDYE